MPVWYSQNHEKVTRAFNLHRTSSYPPASLSAIVSSLVASIPLSLQRIEECISGLYSHVQTLWCLSRSVTLPIQIFIGLVYLEPRLYRAVIQKYLGNPARWPQSCAPFRHHQVVLAHQDTGKAELKPFLISTGGSSLGYMYCSNSIPNSFL